MRPPLTLGWLAAVTLALGCGRSAATRAANPQATLPGPADSLIPDGPLGASIRRGRALLAATRDSLPAHVGNALRCVSCHLDGGRRQSDLRRAGQDRIADEPGDEPGDVR